MSSALAIAGVTATLKDLLNEGLINHNASGVLGNTVIVSSSPLDRLPTGSVESPRLNLFLHQVTPNVGWCNEGQPSRDAAGRTRLRNPPLALDLHYLLTVHGEEALQREILAGYALQLLHETPVLTRAAIRMALDPSPDVGEGLPPALRELARCGLAEQLEQIKITLERFGTEELSKLWMGLHTPYRLSLPYLVTVVLIESSAPSRAPLPVLSRGGIDPVARRERGVTVTPALLPALPMLDAVTPANGNGAAVVGELVVLSGHHLDGADRIARLSDPRRAVESSVAVEPGVSGARASFVLPALPVGSYLLALELLRPGEAQRRTSNRLGLTIGPNITTPLPLTAPRDPSGDVDLELECQPAVEPAQRAALLLGTREIVAEPLAQATNRLSFRIADAAAGTHLVRLRVDGVDSPIIDRSATPPAFLDHRLTIA